MKLPQNHLYTYLNRLAFEKHLVICALICFVLFGLNFMMPFNTEWYVTFVYSWAIILSIHLAGVIINHFHQRHK
ncbi:MAG: hypothetical protein WCQ95_04765 [Bacteroidota bacterium]